MSAEAFSGLREGGSIERHSPKISSVTRRPQTPSVKNAAAIPNARKES
jgi:hypothetical protein